VRGTEARQRSPEQAPQPRAAHFLDPVREAVETLPAIAADIGLPGPIADGLRALFRSF